MLRNKIKKIILLPITIYMLNSVIVSLIDTAIVWVLYCGMDINLVTANTVGVVTGFLIHYVLSSKTVFQTEVGVKGFLVYFGTFLLGLVVADCLIYTGENYIFAGFDENLSFLLSKALSILIPFFILYYLRRYLFRILNYKTVKTNEQHS